jgi:uncharacterized protein with FMN-binding domain
MFNLIPKAKYFEKCCITSVKNIQKGRMIHTIMKIILRILLGILIVAVAMFAFVFYKLRTLDSPGFAIQQVELYQVPDGTYEAQVDNFAVMAKVEVKVKDHQITEINILEHRNGQGAAGEAVVESILAAQSVLVDDISGATYSSKTIRKAVEIALNKAINP